MPHVDRLVDWHVTIGLDAALRGQASDPAKLRRRSPNIAQATAEAITEALTLLDPVVLCRELRILDHADTALLLETGWLECGAWLARRLAHAEVLIALACTIGPALERRVSELFASEPAYALALGGAGTAAVEDLSSQACELFSQRGAQRGLGGTVSCFPGSPEWPADEGQPLVFGLVNPAERYASAVRVLPSGLMWPVKSLSLLLGLTRGPGRREHQCDTCNLAATCRFRGGIDEVRE